VVTVVLGFECDLCTKDGARIARIVVELKYSKRMLAYELRARVNHMT
jgi:hypothetical protein